MKRIRPLYLVLLTGLATLAGLGVLMTRRRRSPVMDAPPPDESPAPTIAPIPPPHRSKWPLIFMPWLTLLDLLIPPLRAVVHVWRLLRTASFGRWRVGSGLLLLTVLLAANIRLLRGAQHVQMALLILGIGLLAWGFSAPHRLTIPRLRRWEVIALAGLTLLALALRLWQLDTAVHYFVDEWHPMRAIIRLRAQRAVVQLLLPYDNIGRFSGVFPYWQYLLVEATHTPLLAMRLVSAVVGTLTIPAVYYLARGVFSSPVPVNGAADMQKHVPTDGAESDGVESDGADSVGAVREPPLRASTIALLTAFLLTVFPPHIHFSRIGLNNIADPLIAVIGFGALAFGLRRNNRADFVLAGVMLGLTQYFYEGGRLLYPAVYLAWMGGLMITQQTRRKQIGYFALTLLVGLLVAAPVLLTWRIASLEFAPRLEITRHPELVFQPLPALFHLFAIPDGSPFYGGLTPILRAEVAPFFFAGLIALLLRPFSWATLLLIPWLAGTILGNGLLEAADETARFVVLFPALMLIAALGIMAALRVWRRLAGWIFRQMKQMSVGARHAVPLQPTPILIRIFIAALVILLGGIQARYYFTEHLAIYNNQVRSRSDDPEQMDHIDVFFRSADLPPGTPIFLITDGIALMTDYPTLTALYQRDLEAEVVHPFDVNHEWVTAMARDIDPNGYAFFIKPNASWSTSLEFFLADHFELDPPQLSPYNVPLERQYVLWYARRSIQR